MAATITGNMAVRTRGSSRAAKSAIANPASTPARIDELSETDTPSLSPIVIRLNRSVLNFTLKLPLWQAAWLDTEHFGDRSGNRRGETSVGLVRARMAE